MIWDTNLFKAGFYDGLMANNVMVGGSRLGLPTGNRGRTCRTPDIFSGFSDMKVDVASHLLTLLEKEGGRINSIKCYNEDTLNHAETISDREVALNGLPRLENVKYSLDGEGGFHMYYEYAQGRLVEVDPRYRELLTEKLKGHTIRYARA